MLGKYKNYLGSLALLFAVACSNANVPPVSREFGTEFQSSTQTVDFNAHANNISACARLDQLRPDATKTDAFSFLDSFSFDLNNGVPGNFQASVKLSESPFWMYLLTSDRVRPLVETDNSAFLDIAKVMLKIGDCPLETVDAWGFGCKNIWSQSAGAMGCNLSDAANSPRCQEIWKTVQAKKELGKCAYVETNAPQAGDAECAAAKEQWSQYQGLAAQNNLFLAKNAYLQKIFPGIFGAPGDASQSLFLEMIAKNAGFFTAGTTASSILTAKLPLFPASQLWSAWRDDMEQSIAAFANGANPEANTTERLCSFVLAQRSFAQVLALNGFSKPEMENGSALPLSLQKNSLGVNYAPGAFLNVVDGAANQPTIVSPNDLANYDPAKKLFEGASKLPKASEAPSVQIENLTDRLDRLLSLELFFEATSPAATWMSANGAYPLGDIEDPGSSAILPVEANALAFGLIAMDFKNLAFLNIRPVTLDGVIALAPPYSPAGFVLLKSMTPDFKGPMSIKDIMRFGELVVRLDAALQNILHADPATLASKNAFYTKEMLAQMATLSQSIGPLKFPLSILLSQMGEAKLPKSNKVICISSVALDLAPGAAVPKKPGFPCVPADQKEFHRIHELLRVSMFGKQ